MGQTPEPGDHVDAHALEPRLDSWKAIAVHLNRDVSTVRRWEKREGLPVHRHLHHKLGSVYAFPSEIDRWWRSRRGGLDRDGRGEEPLDQRASEEGPVTPTFDAKDHVPAVWGTRGPLLTASLGILIVCTIVTLQMGTSRATRVPDESASIAVMPFQFVAVNADADILVDGLTEGIINSLSAASHLKVISSASVFRYKGKNIQSRQAGRELGVRAVLLGRVVQRDGRLKLAVELVDARDDRPTLGSDIRPWHDESWPPA